MIYAGSGLTAFFAVLYLAGQTNSFRITFLGSGTAPNIQATALQHLYSVLQISRGNNW